MVSSFVLPHSLPGGRVLQHGTNLGPRWPVQPEDHRPDLCQLTPHDSLVRLAE